jgi:hypothetical protein
MFDDNPAARLCGLRRRFAYGNMPLEMFEF